MPSNNLRAVIYARYSTDMQNPMSIRDQVDLCTRRAKQEGWTVVGQYSDAMISSYTNKRPDYTKMLGALGSGEFDIILIESLDRIARDQEDLSHIYKRTRHHRVEMHSLDRGKIGAVDIGLAGLMGAVFLEHLRDQTWRGLSGLLKEGKSAGGKSYGYRVGTDDRGVPMVGSLEIVEEEAAIVRRILTEYAAGVSPMRIAAGLNEDCIPAPRHKPEKPAHWKQNTINGNRARGSGILNNELYVGRRVWNRLEYSKHPDTRKRVSHLRAPSEWEIHEVPDLRIVDDALWKAVKARQSEGTKVRSQKPITDRNGLSASRELRRRKYLLSGLLECGICGGKLTIAGIGEKKRYYCSNAKEKGPAVCTGLPGLRQHLAENVVLSGLKTELMQDSAYAAFQQHFIKTLEAATAGSSEALNLCERQIAEKQKEEAEFIKAVAMGAINETLVANLNEVERRLKKLYEERDALTPKPIELPDDVPALYRQFIDNLADTLSGDAVAVRAGDELHELIERVVVRHDKELGHTVEIFGDLVEMFRAADSKNAASYEETASSIKLVAGTGFEPVTFRL